MKEFAVNITVEHEITVWVEAEDWEEAMDIAEYNYNSGEYEDMIEEELTNDNIVDHDISVYVG